MKLKPKYDILLFVIIMILSYENMENMITTNNNISYFGFNFIWKSTYKPLFTVPIQTSNFRQEKNWLKSFMNDPLLSKIVLGVII